MTLPSDMAPIRSLKEYLEDEIPDLASIYDEFPYHGDELKFPCISIITMGTPVYTNLMPYNFKTIPDPENPINSIVYDVIGQYDGRIQLDIWAEYKIQRGRILDLVKSALNKQQIESDLPSGLSLEMQDYHNAIARFDNVGYTYMDSEENSNKAFWRVKLDILFQSPEVIVRSLPRITDLTVDQSVSESDIDNTERIIIF